MPLLDEFKKMLDLKSEKEKMDERFNNGVQVAWIPPSPSKVRNIEKAMGVVHDKVMENATRSVNEFRENMPRFMLKEDDYERAKRIVQDIMSETYNDPHGFAMRIGRESLDKVMSDGKLKNQFQTHSSGGLLNLQRRAKNSARNFGTPLKDIMIYDDASDKLVPGYDVGTASLKNSEKYGFSPKYSDWDDALLQYGEYKINFNPSNVRDRVTFVNGDSLGSDDYPILLKDPETWGGAISGINERIRTGWVRDKYDAQNSIRRLAVGFKQPITYNELQYHGPLGLDDVESIVMPKVFKDDYIDKVNTARKLWPTAMPKWATEGFIPDRWKDQADVNKFNFIDENGNILYQYGSRK